MNTSKPSLELGAAQEVRGALWFAIRVKSNFEKKVAISLSNKGLEAFLPLCQSRRRLSRRYRTVVLPLDHRLPLLTTPGFLYIVSVGSEPAPVDEREIAAVQLVVRSGVSAMPWPSLALGQRVRVEAGPLSGLEGVVIQVGKRDRICVSVTLLQRGVSVEVDRDWIRPLRPTRVFSCRVDVCHESRSLSTQA
jgi:hypothetical protein